MRTRALVVHRAMRTCVVVARTVPRGGDGDPWGVAPAIISIPVTTIRILVTIVSCCGLRGGDGPWNRRVRRCARCGAVDQHQATLLSGPARRRHRRQTLRGAARPRRRKLSARPLHAVLPATVGSKPEARAAAHHSTHRPRECLGPIPPMVLTSQAQPDRPEARRPCGSRARRYFGLARPEAAAGALQRVT